MGGREDAVGPIGSQWFTPCAEVPQRQGPRAGALRCLTAGALLRGAPATELGRRGQGSMGLAPRQGSELLFRGE